MSRDIILTWRGVFPVAVLPGQVRREGGEEVEDGPRYDDVVIDGDEGRHRYHGVANAWNTTNPTGVSACLYTHVHMYT